MQEILVPITKKQVHYSNIPGYHPKYALLKKETTFCGACCHVRFDRKTLPKSGKSIFKDYFIDTANGVTRVWHKHTRALMIAGVIREEVIAKLYTNKFKEIKRRHDVDIRSTSND